MVAARLESIFCGAVCVWRNCACRAYVGVFASVRTRSRDMSGIPPDRKAVASCLLRTKPGVDLVWALVGMAIAVFGNCRGQRC
jgi:hypothetical protein